MSSNLKLNSMELQGDSMLNFKITTDAKEHLVYNNKETIEQQKIYFENSVGKIYDDYIQLGKKDFKLHIKEIAFLQIKSQADRTINNIAFLLAIMFFIGVAFANKSELIIFFRIVLSILFFTVGILYKKEMFFIQIVLCRVEQILIRIHKNQRKEAGFFIKQLAIYRSYNLHLKY